MERKRKLGKYPPPLPPTPKLIVKPCGVEALSSSSSGRLGRGSSDTETGGTQRNSQRGLFSSYGVPEPAAMLVSSEIHKFLSYTVKNMPSCRSTHGKVLFIQYVFTVLLQECVSNLGLCNTNTGTVQCTW